MAEEEKPPEDKPRELEIVRAEKDTRLSDVLRPIDSAIPAVARFFGFAFLFNALLWVFALFVQIRGWVDVAASYVLLAVMWFIKFLICLGLALQSTMTRKKTAITVSSLLWLGALIGLNAVAPKPHAPQEAGSLSHLVNDGHQPKARDPDAAHVGTAKEFTKSLPPPVVSIPETPKRQKPSPATAPSSPVPKPLRSKLRIVNSEGVLMKNKVTTAAGLTITVYFTNTGDLPALGVQQHCMIRIADKPLTFEEETATANEAALKKWDETKETDEMQPGETRFFSSPYTDEEIAYVAKYYDDIVAGKLSLYLFCCQKYRDRSLAQNLVNVTESVDGSVVMI